MSQTFVLDAPMYEFLEAAEKRLAHSEKLPPGFWVVLGKVQFDNLVGDWKTVEEGHDPPQYIDQHNMSATFRMALGEIEDTATVGLDFDYRYQLGEHSPPHPGMLGRASVSLELWGESRPGTDSVSLWGHCPQGAVTVTAVRIIAIQTDDITPWANEARLGAAVDTLGH